MAACPGEQYASPPPVEDLAHLQGKVVSVKLTTTKPAAPRGGGVQPARAPRAA